VARREADCGRRMVERWSSEEMIAQLDRRDRRDAANAVGTTEARHA
jgi:hypothetical protein